MMKRFKLTYALAFVAALSLLTACSSDDAANGGETPILKDGPIKVHLRVSAAGSGTMRAWQDNTNATTEEMMRVWTVVAVNTADNKVAKIYACKPSGEPDQEIDDIVELPTGGTYRFYSFANMSPKVVKYLLGISAPSPSRLMRGESGTHYDNPNGSEAEGGVTDYASIVGADTGADEFMNEQSNTYQNNEIYNIGFAEGATVMAATVNDKAVGVAGNNMDISATNNFGAKGIPMSNVQTITVNANDNVTLVVIRMVAKIELRFYNETGSDLQVNSVTLTNINGNADSNLKLLPYLSDAGHGTMEASHGDIRPNLGTGASQKTLALNINKAVGSGKTRASNTYESVIFYVNESATPINAEGLFYLTLEMDNSGSSEYRYALISNESNEWNYIARNDYRIIPVVLDDLKFEIIPYDFPAIGVYPVSVKEVDAVNHIYDFEFHDYGHFHLLPSVTKGGSAVEFSATTPTSSTDYKWTLINNNFTDSWLTYAAFGDNSQTDNPNGFYRTGTGSTTADGDEEGQKPVWYVNDGLAGPQWAPDATNYRPFIFGYIADPGSATKKQVYHEMKIQVYNGTVAYRQMLYRFYMTLSADQMMYSRMFGAPRVRHTHGY